MNKEKIRQYQEENDSWKRVLSFLQAENNFLKVRLSHLVNQDISQHFLASAENFQNELIQKDELIALNRSALSDFDKKLIRQFEDNGDGIQHVLNIHEKIRTQIEQLEMKFARHRAEFNDHLTANL